MKAALVLLAVLAAYLIGVRVGMDLRLAPPAPHATQPAEGLAPDDIAPQSSPVWGVERVR